jgi:tetratricopeptide (TPR) repeat protein
MARLDRLTNVKGLAQLGATLGREFSYALLQAVSPWDEVTLQRGLHQLVEAEFLCQRGLPLQATYVFKHALIQEAAYQSLLKSTRQQHHQRIAHVLAERFPETAETQPELLAHHWTEAGLNAKAIEYWQHAGQRALERSATLEAVAHLRQGLEVLGTLPDTPERAQQELAFHIRLGPALMVTKGFEAPEVFHAHARARALSQQVGDTQQLFLALWGLYYLHQVQGQLQRACEVGEELLDVAQRLRAPGLFVVAHRALGNASFWRGSWAWLTHTRSTRWPCMTCSRCATTPSATAKILASSAASLVP